jgi:hypothetical protein
MTSARCSGGKRWVDANDTISFSSSQKCELDTHTFPAHPTPWEPVAGHADVERNVAKEWITSQHASVDDHSMRVGLGLGCVGVGACVGSGYCALVRQFQSSTFHAPCPSATVTPHAPHMPMPRTCCTAHTSVVVGGGVTSHTKGERRARGQLTPQQRSRCSAQVRGCTHVAVRHAIRCIAVEGMQCGF